jgi:hypothetical protein
MLLAGSYARAALFGCRYSVVLLLCVCCSQVTADDPTAELASQSSSASLAKLFAQLVERAIPREYDKRKDWGRRKNITAGIRTDGLRIHRRKKPVKHGIWKHYKVRLIEPENTLAVRIDHLRPLEGGRLGFTLTLKAKFDLWARVKVYQYGVHLIALETVGDAAIDLAIDCEIGMNLQTRAGRAGFALDPRVVDARLDITDFHLHRVSNAKGPIIRELGEEFPRIIEHELQGPKLVAKLNKAIEKKRDRLEVGFGEFLGASL